MDEAKILIIDDEKSLRDMLLTALSHRGYRAWGAEDGRDALRKASEVSFDLAVCDLKMPGMGGIETLKALRELHPKTEVIMATGYATIETAVESMKLGAYDYITKPFTLDALYAAVERALERGRLKCKVSELEQVSHLKSEFLATMSHELRTPLSSIVGYTSLILDRALGDIPPAQSNALNRVLRNSKSLLALINDILEYSKLNARLMPVHIEEFELVEPAREVIDMMRCLADEKGLSLSLEAPTQAALKSDRAKIKQILVNLLGNAIKFTNKGGVTLSLEAAAGDAHVCMSVRDTGAGIAPQDVPKIFEEFRQLDGAATRKHGGTGLGLTIAKKLAELLGGEIAVVSEPGRGATFTVILPRTSEPPPTSDGTMMRTEVSHAKLPTA